MNANIRKSALRSSATVVSVAILVVLGGCALNKDGNGPRDVFNRVGGHSGQIIEPKRCLLKVVILSRPYGDPVVRDAIWGVADEQAIPPAVRRAWEANGLRIGRVMGTLPHELETILNDTSPKSNVSPASFFVEDGQSTLIRVSDSVEEASLLVNRDGRAYGRDYRDASGFFRAVARHEGPSALSLRFIPEVQHGPIRRSFQATPNAVPLAPQNFQITTGQHEETMRDLAAPLVLETGQLVVIGCRPEHKRSLGTFMFTQAVAHSDQQLEKVILVWASRNLAGEGPNDGSANTSDRPKLLKRLLGPLPKSTAAGPATPEAVMPSSDRVALPPASSGAAAKPATPPTPAAPSPSPPSQKDPKPTLAPDSNAGGEARPQTP